MKLLVVTHDHPFDGHSGVSMYCRDLLPALARRGFDVGVLYANGRDWRLLPYLRASVADEIARFALVNCPLDPDDSLYRPQQDVSHPAVEAAFRACLRRYRPDAVHVQTFHGYPASIGAIARALGIPVIVSLHDFWPICPRVLLVRPDDAACDGPEGGRNCVRFCAVPRPWQQRLYQLGARLPDGAPQRAFAALRRGYHRVPRTAGSRSMWDGAPAPAAGAAPADDALVGSHAARVAALLRAVAEADGLIAISQFVRSVYTAHGIDASRIRVLPTTLGLDALVWRVRRTEGSVVRFGYLGRAVPLKGAHVFARAIRALLPARARFSVFGEASPEARQHLQTLAGDTPLAFHGTYTRADLGVVLDQIDVAVIPPVAREPLGLTTIEAQAAGIPVVGARIGAIPEYVRHEDNGLLFAPGDADDLGRQLRRLIDDPSLVERLSSHTRPPASLDRHVDALVDIYRTAVEKGRRDAWARSSA